jgi:glutamyl-tRNA synthetase
VPNDSIEDFVILRSDGTAVYNLAVVSDDAETRITHVIRGDDHLANTPKQILLYRALGAPLPVFAHLPMILGADGKRLSKRHGATAVGEYQSQGILPQALLNFLALLGWNAGDDLEVMSVAEMVQLFSLDRVNRKSAVFDPEKLEWMNAQHLMRLPAEEVLEQIAPLLVDEGLATPIDLADRRDWYLRLVRLLQPRARTLPEFVPWARPFLVAEVEYDAAARAKHWKDAGETAARLEAAGDALAVLDLWEPEAIEQALRDRAAELGVGFGKLVHPLRLALTGSGSSPGINDVVGLLGRERVAARIRAARLHLAQPVPRV